jgi:hypothetical protein
MDSRTDGHTDRGTDRKMDNQLLATTQKVNMTDIYGHALAYKYLTPVPTFPRRWAIYTSGTFYSMVRLTDGQMNRLKDKLKDSLKG